MRINSKDIMGEEFELKTEKFEPKMNYIIEKEL
jgi:hypothetical protein